MKKVLLFVGIGLLLLAIPATIYFVGQQRDLRAKAAPATTLTIVPANQTVDVGDEVKLNVTINPGTNQVISVRVRVTFDPTKLEAVSITNGVNAPKVLNSGVVASGSASITVAAASNTQPITTAGTIAVITLNAIGATTAINPANVQFSSDTFAGALSEPNTNVLIGTTGAKITISGPNITPTLTDTPTATESGTPTPDLTPTQESTDSAEATQSALVIDMPAEISSTESAQTVIRGKAPPGSTVTIVVYSEPQNCVAIADENGDYECVLDEPLDEGQHEVTASIQTASGETVTETDTFVVAGENGESIPVSGSVETTILLLAISFVVLVSGTFLWLL